MHDFDVIVVGLGLAGASAAISLAQRGARVLAIEGGTFPRHKVCGEFLSGESRGTLARLQVLEAMLGAGAREATRARIFAPHQSRSRRPRPLESPLPSPALTLSRWALDLILLRQALALGVHVEQNTRVSSIEPFGNGWRVRAGGRCFASKYLLATAGRHAPWWEKAKQDEARPEERFVGIKAHFENTSLDEDVAEMHSWRGGYCGLGRVEGRASNVCLLVRYDSLAGRSPEEFWSDLLREMPALRQRMHGATPLFPWMATANVLFRAPTPLRRLAPSSTCASTCGAAEVMCAGDAAGFIHPLSGDGMAMALRGGELAAATIAAALDNGWPHERLHPLWRGAWEREFSSRLKWSGALQAALIEPRLSRLAMPLLQAAPALARAAVARTRGAA